MIIINLAFTIKINPMSSNLIIYETQDGKTKIQVNLDNETVWLTQQQMATLFGKAKSTINEHIKNIYD